MMEIVFVLVSPAVPENVGAACRALKTMGFNRLRLVATAAHREKPARILAHGAGELLAQAEVFDALASALADVDLAIATSAKGRHQWRALTPAAELAGLIAAKGDSVQRLAVVFGCEESGLSNEQLALCDLVSNIELASPYPSLNLAQAVMLYAYELRGLSGQMPAATAPQRAPDQYAALKPKLARLLDSVGFGADSKLSRWAFEQLPRADAKAVGFLHALVDKLTKPQ